MKQILCKLDNKSCVFALKKVDWEQVSFSPYSAKDCETKFRYILQKIGAVKGDEPPPLPKTPFELFYDDRCQKKGKQNLEFKKLSRKKYLSLKPTKKLKYIKTAAVELYTYEVEAAKYRQNHPNWTVPIIRGPSKKETEMYLLHLGMPLRPPSTSFFLFYYEKKAEGLFSKVSAPMKKFVAAKTFRNLPDDEKMDYKRKFKKVQADYAEAFPAWREQQTQVVKLLTDKYLDKKKVVPVPLITLPVMKDSSPLVRKTVCKNIDRKGTLVSGENTSPGSEENISPGPVENLSPNSEKNASPGLGKNISLGSKENIYHSTKKKTSSEVNKLRSLSVRETISPGTKLLGYSSAEKNVHSNGENLDFSNIKGKSSDVYRKSESDKKIKDKHPGLTNSREETKEVVFTSALDDLCMMQFMPKTEDNLTLKIKKLKEWQKKYKELDSKQLATLENCFERLKHNFETCILADVTNMNKVERNTFLATHRIMLKKYFNYDIFEDIYPLKQYSLETFPLF
nr:nucleolar transcription factor 1-like isoform X5 [Cherax quadricarinatus]XP_053633800.1 nucleolar transcription factor 1-like isoform X5 [Cherax quadricarinatus]XP_053633801.1 nucleolar transcription factor 1-like isoform X5 [Cherax quadricarinatus]